MIRFDSVTFTYPDADRPALADVHLHVPAGELALVIGPTGSGKTTLLRTINGLVPRFSGGTLAGTVTVGGRDTSRLPVREMSDLVGYVAQDPATGFVTASVEEELAYTMEQLGLDSQTMRRRVEEILDLLSLAPLRGRPLKSISGGEAQRVALGAVLTSHPRVMVLDEPTSALDPTAAEEVLAAITRIVHDLGTTVVLAEHRLERVIQYADSVIRLHPDGHAGAGAPAAMMADTAIVPPVVRLGRLAGWSPLPLSVRDARRRAVDLPPLEPPAPAIPAPARAVAEVRHLSFSYGGGDAALSDLTFSLHEGEVVALMGRNGAGKTTLLWALQGGRKPERGRVLIQDAEPSTLSPAEALRRVALVPQNPGDLLYLESVGEECAAADRAAGALPGTCHRLVEEILGPTDLRAHPSDLSEGQRLGLVLGIQLAARPRLILLDEPTRGLDYAAKERLGEVLARLAAEGRSILVATHDVEFVAEFAHRVLVMADGEIVADGSTPDIVVASPIFAPQVAKILGPGGWLTVSDVARALEAV